MCTRLDFMRAVRKYRAPRRTGSKAVPGVRRHGLAGARRRVRVLRAGFRFGERRDDLGHGLPEPTQGGGLRNYHRDESNNCSNAEISGAIRTLSASIDRW